jgi:hypothetical protein
LSLECPTFTSYFRFVREQEKPKMSLSFLLKKMNKSDIFNKKMNRFGKGREPVSGKTAF